MGAELEPDTVRISTAEREAAIEHLQGCAAEGRLSLDEFGQRVDAVYQAATYGQLRPILADLPALDSAASTPTPRDSDVVAPTGSTTRRGGGWLVARKITLSPTGSAVKLNFARATIAHREVEIAVAADSSSVTLVLPRDAWVDGDVESRYSSFANHAQRTGGETGVRFHLHGTIDKSSLRVRRVRRFLWWEF